VYGFELHWNESREPLAVEDDHVGDAVERGPDQGVAGLPAVDESVARGTSVTRCSAAVSREFGPDSSRRALTSGNPRSHA
jgi:hypothetical protein